MSSTATFRATSAAAFLALALSACASASGSAVAPSSKAAPKLRLGYFANLTHATALVGVKNGIFQRALGTTTLETQTFNAGPAAVEALFSDAIDATYVGPSPAVNAFAKSHGEAVRVIS